MENRIIIPNFKLIDADVGTVVFVVEGAAREYDLLERIFGLLRYEKIEERRRKPDFLELRSVRNPLNRVIIIRAENSNIAALDDFGDFFDKMYADFFMTRDLDIRYSPIYYIWDRDPGSNTDKQMKNAMRMMSVSRNEENSMNGLLLASYPCVEAYLITCNEKLEFLPNGEKPKAYVGKKKFLPKRLNEEKVIFGAVNMLATLTEIGVRDNLLDISNYEEINLKIFSIEEKLRMGHAGNYRLLSLISLALMELGVLICEDENHAV